MAGTYTEITAADMDHFLVDGLGFREAATFGEGSKEKVYDYSFETKGGERLAIVVFSSVDERTGVSRDSGNDAIRVVLMWEDKKSSTEKWHAIGSTKRVNRIGTWRKNLKKRLSNWKDMLEGQCPDCGAPLTVRKGEHGKFLGCTRYNSTGCSYTETYNG